jgi:DNA polymerase III delta prime subunit
MLIGVDGLNRVGRFHFLETQAQMADFIFGREEELQHLKQRLQKRKPFLLHGPTGVGKTLLLRSLLPQVPAALYCKNSATAQTVFRSVAQALLELRDPRVQTSCRSRDGIQAKSAVSLKGVVMDALREGNYCIVIDHLNRPSQSFAAVVREIIGWCSTPVVAIARSSHMEDTGFLQPLYSNRSEKCELKNLELAVAEQFAHEIIGQAGLSASNIGEFLAKVLELSEGNPGAILAMLQMAKYPKYRTDEHIKIAPLYIDFRMNWSPFADK